MTLQTIPGTAPGFAKEQLGAFPLFRSNDPEQAKEQVARVFCPHDLRQLNTRHPFSSVHNQVRLGETGLNFLSYGTDVSIDPGCLSRFFLVQLPLQGTAQIKCGTQAVESTPDMAVILNPDEATRMHWRHDAAQLLLWIPRTSIEQRVGEILGDELKTSLRFDLGLQQRGGMTSAWCTMLKDLARNIDENGIDWLRFRPTARALEDCLIRGLIYQQKHNYSARLMQPTDGAESRHMQRAVEYIDSRAGDGITVADIARHANISLRALEEGFRKQYDTTPLIYLRNKRIDRVRNAIVSNALAGTSETITEIAFRHGFFHLGRFSAYYRERTGESPSETARRAAFIPKT